MRWVTPDSKPFESTRVRTVFLFFPTTAPYRGKLQTRWLEMATVREQYYPGTGYSSEWWDIVEFLD